MRPAYQILTAALLGLALVTPAAAGDDLRGGYSTFLHFGASYVKQADQAVLFAMGAPVPGAGFTTEGDMTMSIEAGVFLRGGWAIAASGTVPTTISNMGAGTLFALGNLGDETVGYYALTSQYHFNLRGPISPYAGAGAGYMHVFSTIDGAVTDMTVASAWGPVLQAGIDFHLSEQVGLFVDVKRFWISTEASGTMGPTAITADATVNPWVFSTGVGIRF
jgi:outer membrane protein